MVSRILTPVELENHARRCAEETAANLERSTRQAQRESQNGWLQWGQLARVQRECVRAQWTGAVETLWWRFEDGIAIYAS